MNSDAHATDAAPLRVVLIAPSTRVPIGGVTMIYEAANALARRGHVPHIVHHVFFGFAFSDVAEIEWFDFEPGVEHHFPGPEVTRLAEQHIPSADIFCGYMPADEMEERLGLPVVLIQGWQMMGEELERYAYEAPCPKWCVARWLVDVGIELGVPADRLQYLPIGLRHDIYRLTEPIEGRRPRIGFLYSDHPQKGADVVVAALEIVHRSRPEVDIASFGAMAPPPDYPPWIVHHIDPPTAELVETFYNRTSIFICPSSLEGFGLPSVEAMAGGAALVTTDNGGSHDYAIDGKTALVVPTNDPEALAAAVLTLLDDEPRRVAIAEAGNAMAKTFDWDHTGELLESFFRTYLADPDRYLGDEAERRAHEHRSPHRYH